MSSLEDRVQYLEKLVYTQTQRLELLTNLVDKLSDDFVQNANETMNNDTELDHQCDITNASKIDDCNITIEFGYGSNRDMQTFSFPSVSDGVGESVLKFINDSFTNGKTVLDFLRESDFHSKDDVDIPTNETVQNAKNNIQ